MIRIKIKRLFLITLLTLIPACVVSQTSGEIHQFYNPQFQDKLIQGIGKVGLWGPIRQKILGVAVLDLAPMVPRLAMLNGDDLFYAASIPKLAILWGLFKRVELGEIPLSKELLNEARKMMSISSNESATFLYKLVGPRFILDMLLSPPFKFYDPENGGGIWIGKEYGKGSAIMRDPIGNHAHAATAVQIVRFYYLFDRGDLVPLPLKPFMESTLNKPELIHKFVKGLQSVAPHADVLRKSGSWGNMHADSALISHDGKKYILVAWMNHVQGYLWLEDIVKMVDGIVDRVILPPVGPNPIDQKVQKQLPAK
jgi:beta-lactamase class A